MTNEEKLREVFPKTMFIQKKEEDKTTALMISDEWLESEYIDSSHEEVKIINNMRRNNPLDMTIKEQIEKVKEDCCDETYICCSACGFTVLHNAGGWLSCYHWWC